MSKNSALIPIQATLALSLLSLGCDSRPQEPRNLQCVCELAESAEGPVDCCGETGSSGSSGSSGESESDTEDEPCEDGSEPIGMTIVCQYKENVTKSSATKSACKTPCGELSVSWCYETKVECEIETGALVTSGDKAPTCLGQSAEQGPKNYREGCDEKLAESKKDQFGYTSLRSGFADKAECEAASAADMPVAKDLCENEVKKRDKTSSFESDGACCLPPPVEVPVPVETAGPAD